MKPLNWAQDLIDNLSGRKWRLIEYRYSSAFDSWLIILNRDQKNARLVWDGRDGHLMLQQSGGQPETWIDDEVHRLEGFEPQKASAIIDSYLKEREEGNL